MAVLRGHCIIKIMWNFPWPKSQRRKCSCRNITWRILEVSTHIDSCQYSCRTGKENAKYREEILSFGELGWSIFLHIFSSVASEPSGWKTYSKHKTYWQVFLRSLLWKKWTFAKFITNLHLWLFLCWNLVYQFWTNKMSFLTSWRAMPLCRMKNAF